MCLMAWQMPNEHFNQATIVTGISSLMHPCSMLCRLSGWLKDCSRVQPRAMQMAGELFTQADINKDGKLQLSELRTMLNKASSQYSHFAEHARFLDG